MKHTKGPWKIVPSRFGFGIRAGLTNLCQVSALDGHEANDADAILIASSPDLLETIDELIAALDPVLARDADKLDPQDAKLLNKALYRAFRVSTKARGEG